MRVMIDGIEIKRENHLPSTVCGECDMATLGVMKNITLYCMRDDGLIGPMIEVRKGTAFLNGEELAIVPDECPKNRKEEKE